MKGGCLNASGMSDRDYNAQQKQNHDKESQIVTELRAEIQALKKNVETRDAQILQLQDELTKEKKSKPKSPNNKQNVNIFEKPKYSEFQFEVSIPSFYNLAQNVGWEVTGNFDPVSNQPVIAIPIFGTKNVGKSFFICKLLEIERHAAASSGIGAMAESFESDQEKLFKVAFEAAPFDLAPDLSLKKEDYVSEETKSNSTVEFLTEEKQKQKAAIIDLENRNDFNLAFLASFEINPIVIVEEFRMQDFILLERVKEKFQGNIHVVHNFYNLTKTDEVNEKIKKLMKSYPSLKRYGAKDYYNEPHGKYKIFHYIFARDNTEAGNKFNQQTISAILETVLGTNLIENFDFLGSLKKFMLNNLSKYVVFEKEKEIWEKSEENENLKSLTGFEAGAKINLGSMKKITLARPRPSLAGYELIETEIVTIDEDEQVQQRERDANDSRILRLRFACQGADSQADCQIDQREDCYRVIIHARNSKKSFKYITPFISAKNSIISDFKGVKIQKGAKDGEFTLEFKIKEIQNFSAGDSYFNLW